MELKEKILKLLATSEAMRPGEISEALGIEKKELDKAIKDLKNQGKITSPKRCFYSIEK